MGKGNEGVWGAALIGVAVVTGLVLWLVLRPPPRPLNSVLPFELPSHHHVTSVGRAPCQEQEGFYSCVAGDKGRFFAFVDARGNYGDGSLVELRRTLLRRGYEVGTKGETLRFKGTEREGARLIGQAALVGSWVVPEADYEVVLENYDPAPL